MVIDQTNVIGLSLLSVFLPLTALLHDFVLFQIKVPSYHRFKAFRRSLNVLQHSELDIPVSHNVRVGLVLFLSFHCTLLVLEPRLIEIYLLAHNDGLN